MIIVETTSGQYRDRAARLLPKSRICWNGYVFNWSKKYFRIDFDWNGSVVRVSNRNEHWVGVDVVL